MVTVEKYACVKEAFNDCYNNYWAKWSNLALKRELTDDEWILFVEEGKALNQKYKNTECAQLVLNIVIELNSLFMK